MHRLVGVLQRVVKCWGDTNNGAEKKSEAPLKGSSERTRIVTNRSRSWPRIAQPWTPAESDKHATTSFRGERVVSLTFVKERSRNRRNAPECSWREEKEEHPT
jgi:hypothetical protein